MCEMRINSILWMLFIGLVICMIASSSFAADKEQMVSFVKKAVVYYKQHGAEKAFDEFSNLKGQFIDGELYLYAYDFQGVNVAHGANPKLIGQNLREIQDVDGKYLIKELITTAQKGGGFVEFKWKNPKSGEIEQKLGYVEKLDDNYFVGSGIYFGIKK